jgi:hypothetical protein
MHRIFVSFSGRGASNGSEGRKADSGITAGLKGKIPVARNPVLMLSTGSVFGPFSKAYDRACTEFLSDHPNNDINKQTWPRVFKAAWEASLTVDNIKTGFLATGPIKRLQHMCAMWRKSKNYYIFFVCSLQ